MGNVCPLLFLHARCCNQPTVQCALVVLRSATHDTSGSDRLRGSVLAPPFRGEHSPAEERAYQDDADEVDAQCPPGLRIAAGADPMKSREGKDAEGQHMQPSPPAVANALAQQGTDADSDAHVQSDDAKRHPLRAIVT